MLQVTGVLRKAMTVLVVALSADLAWRRPASRGAQQGAAGRRLELGESYATELRIALGVA